VNSGVTNNSEVFWHPLRISKQIRFYEKNVFCLPENQENKMSYLSYQTSFCFGELIIFALDIKEKFLPLNLF